MLSLDSLQHQSLILDLSADSIIIHDLDGNIIFANKSAYESRGYKKHEMSGMKLLNILAPEQYELFTRRISELYKQGELRFESVHIRKDGSIFPVETHVKLMEIEGNKYCCSVIRDIIERKLAEEKLFDSRQMLQMVLDNIPQRIFWKDRSSIYRGCNKPLALDCGYNDPDELIGKTDYETASAATADIYRADDRMVMETGLSKINYEESQIKPDGSSAWLRTSKIPLRDKNGRVVGVLGMYEDITALKRSEQQTKDALNFMRTMMESSPIGIVSIKATGVVVAINEAMARISGGTVDQLLKQNVRYVEAWKKYGLLSTMDEAVATNSERQIETDYTSTFGKHLWLSVRFIPFTFESEPHVLALFADMSDRKRDESEKEKLQDQLLQAQKMEAVGQLAGGIAHDFNNILTAILGYGDLARLKLQNDDPVRTYLDEIVLSAGRATALTQSLLAFGRKQTLNPQHIDLNAVINKIQKLLIRIIGEDIELTTVLSDKPLVVFADEIQIEQVLLNLATNARDAMQNGGKFIIETDRINIDDEYVRTHGYGESGPYVMLTATDTGGGIQPDIKDRIFEPFFTTKESGKGTGLGLSIVYGIVKQHNGHITVSSEIGKGTTFKILFPISEVRDYDSRQSDSSSPPQRGTETILLVEDDPVVRTLNKKILEEFGYHVIEALDGQDAVEKFVRNKNHVQLLILDVIMPGKNGKEVYDAVKAMDPCIKVLFTSGYPADLIQKKGVLEEGLNFITKPAKPRAFLAKIRSVLEN